MSEETKNITADTCAATIPIFHEMLKNQGVPREHIAFICPMCGTVQSMTDLIHAGAGADTDAVEPFIAFSCVGRWTHRKPPPSKSEYGKQVGCDWTLGGLFNFAKFYVIDDEGKKHPRFMPASAEVAQEHMRSQP